MIDKTQVVDVVQRRLRKLPIGNYLELRTYKRNRGVFIVKTSDDGLLVIEQGYHEERFEVSIAKLPKLLKVLLRREFPRSHKVRLYVMGPFDEQTAVSLSRKIL